MGLNIVAVRKMLNQYRISHSVCVRVCVGGGYIRGVWGQDSWLNKS